MKRFSILLVDDEKNFSYTLSEIFKLHNWSVDIANNGFDAMELVKQKFYDIILIDIRMPGIDGIQTFNEIKKLQSGVVIFLMTGGPIEHLRDLQKNGIYSILQKPINVREIIDIISQLEEKASILVVDDNDNDRTLLSNIFVEKGYRVMTSKTAKEAIDLISIKEFDIVLLDMHLPDMDGITALEKIKKNNPGLAIMAMTGYNLDEIIENAIKKGAVSCFIKPFDIEILLNEINYIVSKKKRRILSKEDDIPKILLIENDEVNREIIKYILKEENFYVEISSSLSEAENKIRDKNFNIIIFNFSLLENTGMSFIEYIREKNKNIILITIISKDNFENTLNTIKDNIDEYIIKPVSSLELIHKIKVHLEKQKLIKEKEELQKQLQESYIRLVELDNTDDFTGLFNRRNFFEQLHFEMQRAKRQEHSLTVVMCDIDRFKDYNNEYGYSQGDKVIKEIAKILTLSVRRYVDKIFRYGGDEFAIIAPELDRSNIKEFLERFIVLLKDNELTKNLNIKFGVVCFDKQNYHISLNELIELLEKELLESKKNQTSSG